MTSGQEMERVYSLNPGAHTLLMLNLQCQSAEGTTRNLTNISTAADVPEIMLVICETHRH